MASIINATTTNGVAVQGDNSGSLQLQTNNGTTAVTIDTSQNVGIGTTTPLVPSSGRKVVTLNGTTDAMYNIGVNGTYTGFFYSSASNTQLGSATNIPLQLYTNDTERMRIDNSGNLLVGTTSSNGFKSQVVTASNQDGISVKVNNANQALRLEQTTNGNNVLFRSVNGTGFFWDYIIGTGSTPSLNIQNQSSNGVYIAWNATSWTGTSDEKLKNITGEISNGVEKVCSLRAAEFTWKSDETAKPQVGLIAQDVEKVLPEAISENEGVLGVRYTEVIPLLVAAIKELKAELDATKAEVQALKGVK